MRFFLRHDKPANNQPWSCGMLRAMGAAIVMLVLFATTANAEKAAQKVTLSFKNAKIEQVFSEISKQTDYRFFYSDEVARKAIPVNISVKDVEVMALLEHLMDGQSMKYKVIAGTIIVNLANHPGELIPTRILPQPIIITQGDDEKKASALPEQATAALLNAERKEKIGLSTTEHVQRKTLLVEEPGGS